MWGAWDEKGRKEMPPKGEFFTRLREEWVVPIAGLFQKKEIKE